ncbi:MAG: hypothetical protein ACI9FR_002427 [Cryomorphaceae bacterium]|jgi:hypothetical protein
MSYILDALGKAEVTRKQENLNELSSGVYRPVAESGTRKFIRVTLFILIPVLSFYFGFLVRPYFDNVQISFDVPSATPSAAVVIPKIKAKEPKLEISNTRVETGLQDAPQETLETAASELLLSVVSYSETASERFAMINGLIVNEGDILSSGEQVLQIDKTSVLLEKEDQSFVVTVN